MSPDAGPLLTRSVAEALRAACDAGAGTWTGSLDLGVSTGDVALAADAWQWRDRRYPYPPALKDRTIHYWDGDAFAPVARFAGALIKLVPTEWGPPTFEIDGIKMLPTARESPLVDARRKVALVEPHGKRVLDTCGGLGYFAACCLEAGAARVHSFEKNTDVLWLRTLNPWSPDPDAPASGGRLQLEHADVSRAITQLADASMDALLHDPPRFGIAGETVCAGVLRPAGARAAPWWTPVPLHRQPEQAHQRSRCPARGREATGESRLQGAAGAGRGTGDTTVRPSGAACSTERGQVERAPFCRATH